MGHTVRGIVTARNGAGSSGATSGHTSVVAGTGTKPARRVWHRRPVNTVQPHLTGTPTQGQTLTTGNGSWSGNPTSYSYAWQACDSSGSGCSTISGAHSNWYTLTRSDVGRTIRSVVTATNSGGSTSASSGRGGPVKAAPTAPTPPSSPTPPPSAAGANCAGTAGSHTINYASLDRCGYPSPNTTGVPGGTSLIPVGSASLPPGVSWNAGAKVLTISASHATVSGLDIPGTVAITGSNDTLTNSRVIAGDGADVIRIGGTSGNTIANTEVAGPGTSGSGLCGRAIHMAGSVSVTVTRAYIYHCADGVVGLSRTSDSFILTNGTFCDSTCTHDEPIYIPGGGGPNGTPTLIEHNTLINTEGQTSAVFGDDHTWGPLRNVTVDNNILEGGDYALELGKAGDGDTNMVVTNNRFARIFYAHGGLYGPVDGSGGSSPVWTGNVWDDTMKAVSAV